MKKISLCKRHQQIIIILETKICRRLFDQIWVKTSTKNTFVKFVFTTFMSKKLSMSILKIVLKYSSVKSNYQVNTIILWSLKTINFTNAHRLLFTVTLSAYWNLWVIKELTKNMFHIVLRNTFNAASMIFCQLSISIDCEVSMKKNLLLGSRETYSSMPKNFKNTTITLSQWCH